MTRIHKLLGIAGLAISAGAFGSISGSAVHTTFSPPSVFAGCEDDECEGGTTCKDNAGGNTECPMEGSGCKTKGCAASVGGGEEILN
jgi:hypothetical protein